MNIKISVPKAIEIFKDIYEQPERLFEMICFDIRETVPKITLQLPNPLAGVIDKSLLSPERPPISPCMCGDTGGGPQKLDSVLS